MGNCMTCCKEPHSSALGNSPSSLKEDMPEAQLYPAPSHVPASAPPDSALLSNGNHLSAPPSAPIPSEPLVPVFQAPRRPKSAPMGLSESKPSELRLTHLFEHYKDSGEDAILAEGIEQLCQDLQVSPDDFRILILAWKLEAAQMCRFSRQEFVGGLRAIRADSVRLVQLRLPELVDEVARSADLFKDLYRFTFRFGLDSAAGQRILPTDMAVVLWRLVFTVREPPILQRWLAFLEDHHQNRGIPKDTWNMFLNFAETVGEDLSSYDDNEAWPSLFDDFVEYENDQANQNITKEKDCEGLFIKADD